MDTGAESVNGKFLMVQVLSKNGNDFISPICAPEVEIKMACPERVVLDAICSQNKMTKPNDFAITFFGYATKCELKATMEFPGDQNSFFRDIYVVSFLCPQFSHIFTFLTEAAEIKKNIFGSLQVRIQKNENWKSYRQTNYPKHAFVFIICLFRLQMKCITIFF